MSSLILSVKKWRNVLLLNNNLFLIKSYSKCFFSANVNIKFAKKLKLQWQT